MKNIINLNKPKINEEDYLKDLVASSFDVDFSFNYHIHRAMSKYHIDNQTTKEIYNIVDANRYVNNINNLATKKLQLSDNKEDLKQDIILWKETSNLYVENVKKLREDLKNHNLPNEILKDKVFKDFKNIKITKDMKLPKDFTYKLFKGNNEEIAFKLDKWKNTILNKLVDIENQKIREVKNSNIKALEEEIKTFENKPLTKKGTIHKTTQKAIDKRKDLIEQEHEKNYIKNDMIFVLSDYLDSKVEETIDSYKDKFTSLRVNFENTLNDFDFKNKTKIDFVNLENKIDLKSKIIEDKDLKIVYDMFETKNNLKDLSTIETKHQELLKKNVSIVIDAFVSKEKDKFLNENREHNLDLYATNCKFNSIYLIYLNENEQKEFKRINNIDSNTMITSIPMKDKKVLLDNLINFVNSKEKVLDEDLNNLIDNKLKQSMDNAFKKSYIVISNKQKEELDSKNEEIEKLKATIELLRNGKQQEMFVEEPKVVEESKVNFKINDYIDSLKGKELPKIEEPKIVEEPKVIEESKPTTQQINQRTFITRIDRAIKEINEATKFEDKKEIFEALQRQRNNFKDNEFEDVTKINYAMTTIDKALEREEKRLSKEVKQDMFKDMKISKNLEKLEEPKVKDLIEKVKDEIKSKDDNTRNKEDEDDFMGR